MVSEQKKTDAIFAGKEVRVKDGDPVFWQQGTAQK